MGRSTVAATLLGLLGALSLPNSACGWSSTGRSSSTSTSTTPPTSCSRKAFLQQQSTIITITAATAFSWCSPPAANAKCTDLESCREIGERRDAELQARYPITKLGDGLQYKVLAAGVGGAVVTPEHCTVRIAYSISQGNGSYMYSRGMGFNKVEGTSGGGGGQQQQKVNDLGLDSLAVPMGSTSSTNQRTVPVCIERALVGAKRGERRRIECPAKLGFETSNWEPRPTTFRGERQVIDYQNTLTGRGGGLPFPAPTVWDVEVVSIR